MAEADGRGRLPERSGSDEPESLSDSAGNVVTPVEHRIHQVMVQIPLPPPEFLAAYLKLGVEPQKVLDLVDADARREVDFDRDLIRMEGQDRSEKNRIAREGQTLGFLLGALVIAAIVIGFFVAPNQAADVAKLVGPAGIGGIVVAFVAARFLRGSAGRGEAANDIQRLQAELESIRSTMHLPTEK